jgi:hypothetical protein
LESHPVTQETHVMYVHTSFDSETLQKGTSGRPWNQWKDIKIDLIETRRESMDWIHLAQDMHK